MASRTRLTLRTDILSRAVFAAGILGAFAAQLGATLFTGLLFGVVLARNIVELVRVFLEGGKA